MGTTSESMRIVLSPISRKTCYIKKDKLHLQILGGGELVAYLYQGQDKGSICVVDDPPVPLCHKVVG